MTTPALVRAALFSATLVGVVAAADFISHVVLSLKFGRSELTEPTTLVLLLVSALAAAAGIYRSVPPRAMPRVVAAWIGVTFMGALCFGFALGTASSLVVDVKPYGALLLSGLLSALACVAQIKALRSMPQQPMLAFAGASCATAVLVWIAGYLSLAVVLPS